PTKEQSDELELLLKAQYGISVVKRPKRRALQLQTKSSDSNTQRGKEKSPVAVTLFEEDRLTRSAIPLNEQIERIINEQEENSFSKAKFGESGSSFSIGKDGSDDEVGKRYLN